MWIEGLSRYESVRCSLSWRPSLLPIEFQQSSNELSETVSTVCFLQSDLVWQILFDWSQFQEMI